MTSAFFQLPWIAPIKVWWSWFWRTIGICLIGYVSLALPIFLRSYFLETPLIDDAVLLEGTEEKINFFVDFIIDYITHIIYFIVSYFTFRRLNGLKYKGFTIKFSEPDNFVGIWKLFIVISIPELISECVRLFIPTIITETISYLFIDFIIVAVLCWLVNFKLLTKGLFGQKFIVIPVETDTQPAENSL